MSNPSPKEQYEDFMEFLLGRTTEMCRELNEKGEEMKIPPAQRMWGIMMVLLRRAVDLAIALPKSVAKQDFYTAFEKLYDQSKAAAAAEQQPPAAK